MTPHAPTLAAVFGLCAFQAAAAEAAGPWSTEAEIGVVSDYRFRGLTLSDEKPAVQGGLTASHASGVYAYAWGSTIAEYGAGADGKGAKAEVDLVVGWAGDLAALGGVDVDVSAQAYLYPGGTDVNYIEVPLVLSKTTGAWTWMVGGAYAPSQKALGHADNAYGWGGVTWADARWPVKIEVRAGYEDGAYAPGGKWDWSAGVSRDLGPLSVGLAYVDSDADAGGLVAQLSAGF